MSTKKHTIDTYKKLHISLIILVGLAIALFFIGNMLSFKTPSNLPANFSFVKVANAESKEVNLKLVLNPQRHDVSFVRIRLYFNPELLQLTNEVNLEKQDLGKVVSVTSMEEANATGTIELSVAQNPGEQSVKRPFEVASLNFTNLSEKSAKVTIVDEETQIVDTNSNLVPFTPDYAELSLNY